jgi:pimeloyl-ACP methyl ester carboxylesterase
LLQRVAAPAYVGPRPSLRLAFRHAKSAAVPGADAGGKPRGAVAYAAPLDLVYDSDNFGASTGLLGGTPQRLPDRDAAASPYALLPAGMPVVCLHGDADQVIPIKHPNTNPVRVGEDLWTKTKAEILKLLGR